MVALRESKATAVLATETISNVGLRRCWDRLIVFLAANWRLSWCRMEGICRECRATTLIVVVSCRCGFEEKEEEKEDNNCSVNRFHVALCHTECSEDQEQNLLSVKQADATRISRRSEYEVKEVAPQVRGKSVAGVTVCRQTGRPAGR
jgi:hypothetical protein